MLRSWVQQSIAGALHCLSDRDKTCRKFQRELAAHSLHNEATVNREIRALVKAGAVVEVEPGQTNPTKKREPKGYMLHPDVRALFPALSAFQKRQIHRMRSWVLQPATRTIRSGERQGQPWHSSSPQSQLWFLDVIAMNMNRDGQTDKDLEELAALAGFKKKSKASGSSAALIAGDLERFRRIARTRRFDPKTGACLRTLTQIAAESGFIPEHEATAPPSKTVWPPPEEDRNATKLYHAIFTLAGGLHKAVKLTTRALARAAYHDVSIK
jgi:hypothetical protein